jgi:hypothetical protein
MRSGRLLLAVLLILAALTGCQFSIGRDSPIDVAEKKVLGDHAFEIDVRRPPTRADLGIDGDTRVTVYQPPGHDSFRSTITLTDGQEATLESASLAVVTDGQGGPVDRVEISSSPMSRSELEQQARGAEDLGAKPADVSALLEQLPEHVDSTVKRFLTLTSPAGYDIELEVLVAPLQSLRVVYLLGFPPAG